MAPRKQRKTKGRKPRVPKTERRKTLSETSAYVLALYEAGKPFGKISEMTGVKVPAAKTIVRHAKIRAA
jgi:DNA invertase Pin-like site-specific DNA recombinase